jgi:hypothetical protein
MTMKIYQYGSDGYFIAEEESPDGSIPHNGTDAAPEIIAGYKPRFVNGAWTQAEDHKGEKGYLNGDPFEITEYGPYPEGWSAAPPPKPLVEVKADKLAEINAAKWSAIENGDVEYEGLRFHTDSASQSMLGNAILMYQSLNTLPQVWKAKDGYLTVTAVGQLTAIGALVAAYVEGLFGTEYALRGQVETAETVEAVEAVVWAI